MKKGMVRVLRMYMGADAETVATASGIPLSRYNEIESCDAEPDESEMLKLSAVFGMDEDVLTGKREVAVDFTFRQPLDESVFDTPEVREMMKLRMTELSREEKQLILLIRSAEDSEQMLKKLTDSVCNEIF